MHVNSRLGDLYQLPVRQDSEELQYTCQNRHDDGVYIRGRHLKLVESPSFQGAKTETGCGRRGGKWGVRSGDGEDGKRAGGVNAAAAAAAAVNVKAVLLPFSSCQLISVSIIVIETHGLRRFKGCGACHKRRVLEAPS